MMYAEILKNTWGARLELCIKNIETGSEQD